MYKTKIKNIKEIGYQETYDLHTPIYNNFLLDNGILSHNSGKSYTAVSLGEEWDPNFNIRNVVFNAKEFMTLVNSGKLQKGSCIVFDEAGISLSSSEWYNITNKLINYVLQTFRHMNFIVIFTCPYLNLIAKSSRILFHCTMQTLSIDRDEKRVVIKPLLLQLNPHTGKLYLKYLRFRMGEDVLKVDRIHQGLPSKEILELYEERKTEFTKKLNKEIERQLEEMNKKKYKPLTEKQKIILDLLKQGYSVSQICKKLGCALRIVQAQMDYIRKKNIDLIMIRKGNKVTYEVVEG